MDLTCVDIDDKIVAEAYEILDVNPDNGFRGAQHAFYTRINSEDLRTATGLVWAYEALKLHQFDRLHVPSRPSAEVTPYPLTPETYHHQKIARALQTDPGIQLYKQMDTMLENLSKQKRMQSLSLKFAIGSAIIGVIGALSSISGLASDFKTAVYAVRDIGTTCTVGFSGISCFNSSKKASLFDELRSLEVKLSETGRSMPKSVFDGELPTVDLTAER